MLPTVRPAKRGMLLYPLLTGCNILQYSSCMDTYSDVVSGLKNTTIPFTEIAERADVSLRWLYAVACGDIREPGISRCTRVLSVLRAERGEPSARQAAHP